MCMVGTSALSPSLSSLPSLSHLPPPSLPSAPLPVSHPPSLVSRRSTLDVESAVRSGRIAMPLVDPLEAPSADALLALPHGHVPHPERPRGKRSRSAPHKQGRSLQRKGSGPQVALSSGECGGPGCGGWSAATASFFPSSCHLPAGGLYITRTISAPSLSLSLLHSSPRHLLPAEHGSNLDGPQSRARKTSGHLDSASVKAGCSQRSEAHASSRKIGHLGRMASRPTAALAPTAMATEQYPG